MKKTFQGTLLLSSLLLGSFVQANELEPVPQKHWSIGAGAYAFTLENDDFSAIESDGFDLMAYGGVGLSKKGFRGYGGAGFFSDKWSALGENETMSGFQLGGGLGYNWGPAALDFVLTLRQADEYEDFMYRTGTYVAVSGNLTISYLF